MIKKKSRIWEVLEDGSAIQLEFIGLGTPHCISHNMMMRYYRGEDVTVISSILGGEDNPLFRHAGKPHTPSVPIEQVGQVVGRSYVADYIPPDVVTPPTPNE